MTKPISQEKLLHSMRQTASILKVPGDHDMAIGLAMLEAQVAYIRWLSDAIERGVLDIYIDEDKDNE